MSRVRHFCQYPNDDFFLPGIGELVVLVRPLNHVCGLPVSFPLPGALLSSLRGQWMPCFIMCLTCSGICSSAGSMLYLQCFFGFWYGLIGKFNALFLGCVQFL